MKKLWDIHMYVNMTVTLQTLGITGAVVKSSEDGLVDTEFASQYQLQLRAGILGRCKTTTLSSFLTNI